MNAPSNANTSGLEVVAWEYRFRDTGLWHRTESASVAEDERKDGSEVRPYSVTAASAQARIDAAEARADRAEARIAEIATMFGVCDGGRYLNDWKARLAALQQETQP